MHQLFYSLPVIVIIIYVLLICTAIVYWGKTIQPTTTGKVSKKDFFISILIPFRNEALNLPALLDSLRAQSLDSKYWECILIDDHSTDAGYETLLAACPENFRIIKSIKTGKKNAIAEALTWAKGNYFIQTDADCTMGKEWLSTLFVAIQNTNSILITGAVGIHHPESLIGFFQAFDFMAFMGMTKAGIESRQWYLANGANLAYAPQVYEHLKKSPEQERLASGDDMFLIQAASELDKEKIFFLCDPAALVQTRAIENLKSLIHQRLRWGSKTGNLKDWKIKVVLSIPLLFSFQLMVTTIYSIAFGEWWWLTSAGWGIKLIIDYIYLKRLAPFFNQPIPVFTYLICALIYPAYLILMLILSIFKRDYEWKGRVSR